MAVDEGYIKFNLQWRESPALVNPLAEDLCRARNILWNKGLIGFSEEHQVGFGNASVRLPGSSEFLISGTQTGHVKQLDPGRLSHVKRFDLDRNILYCEGPTKASSESLTHGCVYQLSDQIGAVLHGHHAGLWRKYLEVAPTTPASVPYGTPEMARATKDLYAMGTLAETRFFVMGGHEDGVFAFGETLDAALAVLLSYFESV